jgi:hypothetical protein
VSTGAPAAAANKRNNFADEYIGYSFYTVNKKSFKKDLGQSLRRSAPDANGEEMATLPQRSTVGHWMMGHWMMREAYSIRSLMGL